MKPINEIGAVIPAAGLSFRMGNHKLMLPWGSTTIIGHIINTISSAGINHIYIVIDPQNEELKEHLEDLGKMFQISIIEKPENIQGDMLSSIQIGLKAFSKSYKAALIALGDQPQIQSKTINKVIDEFLFHNPGIVIPSFNMRRGHPWLIGYPLFEELLRLDTNSTARDFLKKNDSSIRYVVIDNNSILNDIDTPLEYRQALTAFEGDLDPDT